MSKTTLSGYTGLFKQPLTRPTHQYITTNYFTTNIYQDTLVVAMLTPESFTDIIHLISLIQFKNIIILSPALDVLFISDLFNAFMLYHDRKPYMKWVFPNKPTMPTSTDFEIGQIISNEYILPGDMNHETFDIKFEYILSNKEDRIYYDIKVSDGISTKYLCTYCDANKLELLMKDISINEVHISFSSTLYGGLNYLSALDIDKRYGKKLVINSFNNPEEYYYSIKSCYRIGEVRINDII